MQSYDRAYVKCCVPAGWVALIDRIYDAMPDGVVVHQVKEKFGGLRFYYGREGMEGNDNALRAFAIVVTAAESESYTVCDECGQPGQWSVIDAWRRVLCEDHRTQVMATLDSDQDA